MKLFSQFRNLKWQCPSEPVVYMCVQYSGSAVMLPQGTRTITFFTVNKRGLFFPTATLVLTTRNLSLAKTLQEIACLRVCVFGMACNVLMNLLRTYGRFSGSNHKSAYIKLGCFGTVKGGSGPIRRGLKSERERKRGQVPLEEE